jgi:phosphatidate cytidylyltransferase
MAAQSPGPVPPRFGDLKLRVVSGLAAAAVGLTLLYFGGVWTMFLVGTVAGAMAWELRSITLHRGGPCGFDAAYLLTGVVGGVVVAEFYSAPLAVLWLVWLLAGSAFDDIVRGRKHAIVWASLGGAYIGGAAIAFSALRAQGEHGFAIVLWLVLVVAATDIGAYFAGRVIGGPRLWPRVSPKKTWAGLGGGIALAVLTGLVFSLLTAESRILPVCIVSAVAAIVAQAGDLAESAVKRHFGVKDSSGLLPGHGGALDRFDGLMAVALVAGLVIWGRGQAVLIW